MQGNEVERFLGASHDLANRNNLPTHHARRQENFDASRINKITLGRMLAQVAIIPTNVNQITLIGYGGDERMMAAVKGRVEGSTLKFDGDIPFKSGGGHNSFGHSRFGNNAFVGGNITIGNGSFTSFSSSGGGDMIVLDGREVDLERAIQLVLMVPTTMNVKVGGLIGAVGITDHLDAELDFSPSIRAELSASSVRSLIGDLSGSGKVTLGNVIEDADLEITGSGSFRVNTIGGKITARVTGSGNIVVEQGTSRILRASVTGSGQVRHGGTVDTARLSVTGSGHILAANVRGDVDHDITGSGTITFNGKTNDSRW